MHIHSCVNMHARMQMRTNARHAHEHAHIYRAHPTLSVHADTRSGKRASTCTGACALVRAMRRHGHANQHGRPAGNTHMPAAFFPSSGSRHVAEALAARRARPKIARRRPFLSGQHRRPTRHLQGRRRTRNKAEGPKHGLIRAARNTPTSEHLRLLNGFMFHG